MKSGTQGAELKVDPQRQLCEDVALALHSMAQPLTILRGAIGALTLGCVPAIDVDRYIELSNTQVERLCSMLSGMRMLLDNFQFDAVCAPTNLRELIASIIENEDSGLHRSGLQISVEEFKPEFQVLADPVRTEQAIHAVLAALATASSVGDEITLTFERRDSFADVTMHAKDAEEKKLTAVDRFRLSVAEASIRSQHGVFERLADPLRISFRLPLHDRDKQESERAGFSVFSEQVEAGNLLGSENDRLIAQVSDW